MFYDGEEVSACGGWPVSMRFDRWVMAVQSASLYSVWNSVRTLWWRLCGFKPGWESVRLRVVNAEYLACVDDDITSAFYATEMYYQIHDTYGYYPTILCVGGVGPLSKQFVLTLS